MKTLPWNDAAKAAVATAHAAHLAVSLALENPKREGMSCEEDEAFMRPLHDAADAADIAVLEACPETMRGFTEKAKYLAELWLGIEVEPGWTYDKMREENAPLDPPLFVATIARDAAAMIESGEAQ